VQAAMDNRAGHSDTALQAHGRIAGIRRGAYGVWGEQKERQEAQGTAAQAKGD